MTKEEYLAKIKANREKQVREWEEAYRKKEEKYVNQAIENIINCIENAYTQQGYVFSQEEIDWLSKSDLFNKKLDELRKKYDFLEIYINTNKYLGFPNEIRNVRWRVKGE